MGNVNIKEIREEVLKEIYKEIYTKIENKFIIVFLCGGSALSKRSIRDRVRALLEKPKNKPYKSLPIKVFYPEDLFIEILNKDKSGDLLSYEQLLAENSHIISIICESPGSLVELGAFTNNDYTVSKVLAAVEKRHANDKSFIMLGPIKYLKKQDNVNVLEFGSDVEDFSTSLNRAIQRKYTTLYNKDNLDIKLNSIMGMYYFIQIVLYFYKIVSSKDLTNKIKLVMRQEGLPQDKFDIIFNAALNFLYVEKIIVKNVEKPYSKYLLTKKGYSSAAAIIDNCTSRDVCDKIRIKIMYYCLYKSPRA